MDQKFNSFGLQCISDSEAAYVLGGVDKGAQDALYTIGYILGLIASYILSIFGIVTTINTAKKA